MMNELIPRDAVKCICRKETVSTNPDDYKHSNHFLDFMDDDAVADFGRWQWANGFNTALVTVEVELAKLPFAQPERKAGRWERHYSRPNVYADLWWHCSICGYKNADQYANRYHHYCPNCGAKMEVEHE